MREDRGGKWREVDKVREEGGEGKRVVEGGGT